MPWYLIVGGLSMLQWFGALGQRVPGESIRILAVQIYWMEPSFLHILPRQEALEVFDLKKWQAWAVWSRIERCAEPFP